MWQKTQRVLTAWGDKRSIQAAALILDMCLFILSFFPRFKLLDFNALILLILFYSLQSLLFNKQGTLLLEAEYIWHKKYAAFMKVGLVVGAIFFVYTLIPIFLYVYIHVDIPLPFNDCNLLYVSITYGAVLEVLALLLFYRPESAGGDDL
ncbi:MAG: hypothetical protein HFF42_05140 [Lawsonibacter sp.]|jgi:hypothetical protein|nr:hypothetical protein [Lawsonibacter sp.]